ncbi:TA system VapC family ribonuclease toxin [Paramicrobacterium sp. CJ85]|uniref:TA system VapC family ribonuclease toxin n=1 Tax=Paramicrobacterium sp. CJ85 TaxID=3445355 RepID=UPI003F5FB45A
MILPDVNVLVYAFDEASPHHEEYSRWLTSTLSGREELALFDPVLAGFVRIVTHPRIMVRPADTRVALEFVDILATAPRARWIRSSSEIWATLNDFVTHDAGIKGNLIPDALIAAAAIANGARVATADRGFSRFPGVQFFDPTSATT